jgi:hypothetical protein
MLNVTCKVHGKEPSVAQTKEKAAREKEATPETGVLHVAFVWDMSGSMGEVRDATVEGTREYIADLQKEERELAEKHGEGIYTRLSLTAFDTVFEKWLVDMPVGEVQLNMLDKYEPRGMTALYDAVANTVTDIDAQLRAAGTPDEKVMCVIMTDGKENSSVEYHRHQGGLARLNALITAMEAKGNWTFIFLGANQDAWAVATSMGIAVGNTASYTSENQSITDTSQALHSVTRARRASSGMSSSTAFADAGASQDYRTTDKDVDYGNPVAGGSTPDPTQQPTVVAQPGDVLDEARKAAEKLKEKTSSSFSGKSASDATRKARRS